MVDATRSPLMSPQDAHVFMVEAELSPLKGLTRAFRDAQQGHGDDLRCGWMGFRYNNKNLGEWVGRLVEGEYYESISLLHDNDTDTPIPVGNHFVVKRVEKNKPFISEDFLNEALDDDLVGDFCELETLHPVTGRRLSFSFWANQNGFPQFRKVTNQMVVIAIAATGL